MATAAQNQANRKNARHSTGPLTDAAKTASSLNHFQHGLSGGVFRILPLEDGAAYHTLLSGLREEHDAITPTENILVASMAQHHWLSQRAQSVQSNYFVDHDLTAAEQKNLALYLRYQTTHQRAFFKCLNELAKLRSEKRKQEIGFEREKRCEAEESRRQEAHEARTRAAIVRAKDLEFNYSIREASHARFPAYNISLSSLKDDLQESLKASVARKSASAKTPVETLDPA